MRRTCAVPALAPLLLVALSFLACALTAQQDLRGDAILSYQLFGSDELDSRSFHQIYDLGFQRNVTDPLRLRLTFRGEGNIGSTDLGLQKTSMTFWRLQPGAELAYSLPTFRLRGTYDLYDTHSSTDAQPEDLRKLQRYTATLSWGPESYPNLTAMTDQRRQRDALAGINEDDGFTVESLTFTRPTFTLGQTAVYQTQDMNNTGFARRTYGVQGQAQYQDTLLDGRLTAGAYLLGGVTRIEDRAGHLPASVPTQVAIPNAAVSHDETPSDSRDVPPLFTPALTDGNFAGSAGVSLGPDGLSFQNLFLDLQRFLAVDEVRIFVRDAGGNFVRTPGLIEWTVYTSVNNLDWTPVPGASSTTFITTLSAYDIDFPQTAARYFKLVSFGTNSVETFVTEIQAFFHTSFAAGENTRTDVRSLAANVQVSGRIASWLSLSYFGSVNDSHTSPTGKAEYSSLDHDQIVTLESKPFDKMTATLRYEYSRSEAGADFAQSLTGYWATLLYSLTPRTTTTIEASHVAQTGDQDITTDTLRLHQYARLYGSLDLYLDAGVAHENFDTLRIKANQIFLTGYTYAQMTRSIRLTLSANYQQTKYDGAGALEQFGSLDTHVGNYYAELDYRPSPKLLLSGRFGWVTGTQLSGAIQRYRLEWYPFAGGTIGIGTVYDDNVETNGFTHRFRRLQLLPHWQVNSHAVLDLNYSYVTLRSSLPGQAAGTSQKQFYANLTLNL
jgi:hypothetical protein